MYVYIYICICTCKYICNYIRIHTHAYTLRKSTLHKIHPKNDASVLQCVAVCCSVLQCRSALQRVAVRCRVLQCVDVP